MGKKNRGRARRESIFLVASIVAVVAGIAGAVTNILSTPQEAPGPPIATVAVIVSAIAVIVSVVAVFVAQRQASDARETARVAEYQADLLSRRLQLGDDGSAHLTLGPEEVVVATQLLAGNTRMNPAALMLVMQWASAERRMRETVKSATDDDMTGLPVSRLIRRYGDVTGLSAAEQDRLREALNVRNKCAHGLEEEVDAANLAAARATLEDFLKNTPERRET